MQSIVLTVHLILAVLLIGVVLLQRSEGGGLGMGSGGGGVMTGRQAANALTRATWLLAAAFIVTSITLTILAARGSGAGSVLDRITDTSTQSAPTGLPNIDSYAPPPGVGQPVTPPSPSGASTPAADTPPATTPVPAEPAAPAAGSPATPAPAESTPPAEAAPAAPAPTN